MSVSNRREPILSVATANPAELFIIPPNSDRTCNRYGVGVTVRVGISKAAAERRVVLAQAAAAYRRSAIPGQ